MCQHLEDDLPDSLEFAAFWESVECRNTGHKLLVLTWILIASSAALLQFVCDVSGQCGIVFSALLVCAVSVYPLVFKLKNWMKERRFIRCRKCGLWIGKDHQARESMANRSNETEWVRIARTGRCTVCNAKLIKRHASTDSEEKSEKRRVRKEE